MSNVVGIDGGKKEEKAEVTVVSCDGSIIKYNNIVTIGQSLEFEGYIVLIESASKTVTTTHLIALNTIKSLAITDKNSEGL